MTQDRSHLSASHTRLDEAQIERVLVALMRAEFQAPATAMVGLIDFVIEDASRAGLLSYGADLGRMRAAATKLAGMMSEFLENQAGDGARNANRQNTLPTLRHNLKTPLAAIIGYAELVAEEARDNDHHILLNPLAEVLDAATRLLGAIDRLVDASDSSDAKIDSAPTVLRQTIDMVRQLAKRSVSDRPGATGRILIVDDNPSIIDLLSRRLAREGHEVVSCDSGERALELAEHEAFDLVLLDVMMPGMTGIEVLRRLKAKKGSLPIIMISALDELDTIVRCIEEGADDYLPKPVNPTLLRARVTASLERKFLRDREQAVTAQLRVEHEHSDKLLRNVLPDVIVGRLQRGEAVEADYFDHATILFCDLVGFTTLTSIWPPAEIIELLNEIFLGFDHLASRNGLEKIKTIGDAYLVAGGVPESRPDHAAAIASMALGMPEVVARAAALRGVDLNLRIGIDTGPVVAGIIGAQKFFYDVWGDTVNTASRMEAQSEPGRIQITKATFDAIAPEFKVEARGMIEVKGKGLMETFFLLPDSPALPVPIRQGYEPSRAAGHELKHVRPIKPGSLA